LSKNLADACTKGTKEEVEKENALLIKAIKTRLGILSRK